MILNNQFEIINVADEYILVPVGDQVLKFSGVVAITDATAYLLEKMRVNKSEDELVRLLTEEYDVDAMTARADINETMKKLLDIGVISE